MPSEPKVKSARVVSKLFEETKIEKPVLESEVKKFKSKLRRLVEILVENKKKFKEEVSSAEP